MNAIKFSIMDFNTILDALAIFNNNDGINDEYIKYFKVGIQRAQYDKLANMMLNQAPLDNSICSLYSFNIYSFEFNYIIDEKIHPNELHCGINMADNIIQLRMPHLEMMASFLKNNNKNKYLFLPFGYDSNGKSTMHRAHIIFNTQERTIHMADPNGYTDYYSDTDVDVHNAVDTTLINYFKYLEEFYGYKYTFVRSAIWNPKKISINKTSLDSYTLGAGQCVASSLLLTYLHCLTEYPLISIYESLANLHEHELAYLISSYIVSTCELLKQCLLYVPPKMDKDDKQIKAN